MENRASSRSRSVPAAPGGGSVGSKAANAAGSENDGGGSAAATMSQGERGGGGNGEGRKGSSCGSGQSLGRECRGLLASVVNHNPFYLLSACSFLYALTLIFRTDDIWINTAVPLGLIAGYAVLMAFTAVFIVRLGGVWDDARSIVMIMVVLLCVLSVAIDQMLMEHLGWAVWVSVGGLSFAIGLSEFVRRGLRLEMPVMYRIVHHGMMALLFLYPCLLAHLVNEHGRIACIRGIMSFPVAAGILGVGLVWAMRRGMAYMGSGESPWRWPCYPWALFGILGGAVCVRTYLMSISFVAGKGVGPYGNMETGFGFYMLFPFIAVMLAVVLEYGMGSASKSAMKVALSGPLVMLAGAIPTQVVHAKVYHEFTAAVLAGGGRGLPLLVATCCGLGFYVYALTRKARHADLAMVTLLLLVAYLDST